MRSIVANNTSGSQGIYIAAARWWASLPESLPTTSWLDSLPVDSFNRLENGQTVSKKNVGMRYSELRPDYLDLAWKRVQADPGLKFCLQAAIEDSGARHEHDGKPNRALLTHMDLFRTEVLSYVSDALWKSAGFHRFTVEIQRHKRDSRVVRKVLEQ